MKELRPAGSRSSDCDEDHTTPVLAALVASRFLIQKSILEFQIVQAFFMLGFVAMAAGALWFFMERNDLKPELRPVATYATVIAFVAAVLYYVMKDVVQFPLGDIGVEAIRDTVELRYIDWLITTPLLLIEFGIIVALAGAAKKGFVWRGSPSSGRSSRSTSRTGPSTLSALCASCDCSWSSAGRSTRSPPRSSSSCRSVGLTSHSP